MKSEAAQFHRLQGRTLPFVITNGQIYSFAINEQTSELLYADIRGLHLVSISDNAVVRSIPYTDLIKQELTRLSDRKQQEIVQNYASHGVQHLWAVQPLNIWLGVISRKRFVFFSEELAVSSESPIDISGITAIKVDKETGDIFTLTGEGKVMIWMCEIISDSSKKRVDFDVKIVQKKTFGVDSSIEKFDMATKGFHYLACIAENPANSTAVIHLWDYHTGEKLPSIAHTEGYSPLSVTAIGLKCTFLAFLDANKTIIIRDLEAGAEIHRKSLSTLTSSIDYIVFEEWDLTSGIYLIDNTGKIVDYSATVPGVLSSSTHSKTKESDLKGRNADKIYITGLRSQFLDDKAIPGSINSRFNTIYAIVTLFSGLKQIWALHDGCLDVINLASIGEMMRIEGKVAKAYRLQFSHGAAWAFPSPGVSEVMAVQTQAGALHLLNTLSEQTLVSYNCAVSDSRGPGLCALTLEMNSMVIMSPAGLISCQNIQTNAVSQGFQLTKLTITSLCLSPKYPVSHPLAKENDIFFITMGTDSGIILVFEYNPRGRGIELKKRYAAHDAVLLVTYRYWDRRVMTAGRDGYVKFLQCDNYYEWDNATYKGFWTDCSTCGLCGHSMVILGYESGMLQTLYFSPSTDYPISGLLEYHTTAIRTVCGLDLSLAEAASADNAGQIVLWNLEKNEPLRVFRVNAQVDSLVISGNPVCDALLVVIEGSIYRLRNDKKSAYTRVTRRDIQTYKAEIKRKRMDQKKKNVRSSNLLSSATRGPKADPKPATSSIKDLYAHISAVKQQLELGPVEDLRHVSLKVEDELQAEKSQKSTPADARLKQIIQLMEDKRMERFKKSLTLTIRNINVLIPREVFFHRRFQAKRIMITPLIFPESKGSARAVTTTRKAKPMIRRTEPDYIADNSESLTELTKRFGFLSERSPRSTTSQLLGKSNSQGGL